MYTFQLNCIFNLANPYFNLSIPNSRSHLFCLPQVWQKTTMSYNTTEVIWFRYMSTRGSWWGKRSQSYKDSSYAPKSIIKLTTILPFPKDLTLRKSSPLKQKLKLYPGNLDTHLWNNFQSTSFVIGKTFSFICRLTQAANDIEKSASAHPKRIATRPQNEYLRRKIDKKSLWVPISKKKLSPKIKNKRAPLYGARN